MELSGVDVRAHPECLHRAGRGTGEQDSVPRQSADRLLVADERLKGAWQPAEQPVAPALLSERDLNLPDWLAIPPVHDRALVPAEHADAIAGPKEGEVRRDHLVKQPVQIRL